MTKSEFVQRVAIALAGNPKFVDHVNFNYCDIVDKADALADTMEDRSRFAIFDNEGETPLESISESLADIRKYLNNPNDNDIDISAPQEIAKSIWDIEGHLRNIAASTSDIADNG